MKTIVCLLSVLFLSACSQTNRTVSSADETVPATWEKSAATRLGADAKTEHMFNADKSYVIVMSRGNWRDRMPTGPFRFVVAHVESGEIILEDSVVNGSVKWRDQHRVELTSVPGIISGEEQGSRLGGYIFDCRDKSKTART